MCSMDRLTFRHHVARRERSFQRGSPFLFGVLFCILPIVLCCAKTTEHYTSLILKAFLPIVLLFYCSVEISKNFYFRVRTNLSASASPCIGHFNSALLFQQNNRTIEQYKKKKKKSLINQQLTLTPYCSVVFLPHRTIEQYKN